MDDLAPLQLPNGRSVQVAGEARDLTVLDALRYTGGEWEPHIRALFERLIQPEWTCLDIGANIGAHTLAMAALATRGEVVAYEASSANHAYLERNAARLDAPKARITAVRCALWDRPATLELAGSPEFAGGTFVAEQTAATHGLEGTRHTQPVGDNEVEFTMHVETAPAVRLDDWIADNDVNRLDLIKLDVEGAERRVLAGAERTLRRFRPLLVTEYNPDCATSIFGDRPDAYFRLLRRRFAAIRLIEPDGELSEPLTWPVLNERLPAGKGWEDLLCEPRAPSLWRRPLTG